MIQYFKSLNATSRVRWFLSLFATLIFLIISIYIFVERRNNLNEKTDNFVFSNLYFLQSYAEHNQKNFENEKLIVNSIIDTLNLQVDQIKIPDTLGVTISFDSVIAPYKATKGILDHFGEMNALNMEALFYEKRYYENGFAMLLDTRGNLLIHPTLQGENIRRTKLFAKLVNQPKITGKFSYDWPETDASEKHLLYYSFSKKLDAYILITIFEKDVYTSDLSVFLFLFLIYLFVISFINLVVWLIVKNLGHWLGRLDEIIAQMAKGSVVDKIDHIQDNDVGRIVNSLNTLIETTTRNAKFANEITKGNLHAEFKAQSKVDILGNSLLEMRESLIHAKEEERKRQIIDNKQKWITTGLAKFGDILRQDNDNIENLSYNLINNLVSYLEANQGGIFIQSEDEETGKLIFELKSSVAYNKRKYIQKIVEEGEGLIGRCAKERSTIYLTEVPDGYIEIRSGMGHSNPKSILIVPLKVDNQLYGVVEIASFKELEKHEIEFVEKIGENIASTIASVKINLKTAKLLFESEKQSKKLEQQEEDMRINLQELQRTQELAAKNEETALGFVNAVNHTIIRADFNLEGKLTYANTKLLESMEYSSSELNGVHYSFFMQKKDMKAFDEAWNRLVKGGTHYEQEVEYKTKFGKIWLLATYTAVRDRKGNVVKVLYLAIDISKEKERSINYENDMRAINASILKSEYKPDGTVVDDNDIFLNTLGYRRAETVGKNLFDFLDTEKQKNFNNIWAQVLSGIAVDNIEKITTKAGEEKWFKGTYTPVKNTINEVYKIIYIANEISAQKRLEEETRKRNNELLAQEKELQQIIKHSSKLTKQMQENEFEMKGILRAIDASTFSMELNLDNQILKVNSAYAKLFNLTENEFINRRDRDLFLMANPEEAEVYDKLWNEVKFGLTKRAISRILINNVEAWLVETYTPIFDAENNVYKILKIATDITKNKLLEIEASQQAEMLREQEGELIGKMQELEIAQKEMEVLQTEDERRNKETLETIEKHRKTLTDIIDNVPGLIFVKDNTGKLLVVNEAVAKTHNKSKESLIGKTDFDFYTPDLAQRYWNEDYAVINGQAKTFIQNKHILGEERILQTTKMPFYISYMGTNGLLVVQTDITELKRMEMEAKAQNEALLAQEEEMRQNLEELQATQDDLEAKMLENESMHESLSKEKALLDTLLKTIPDAVYFKDINSKFIRASQSIIDAVGLKNMNDIVGKSDFDFFEKESATEYFEEEQSIIRSGNAIVGKIAVEKRKTGADSWSIVTKMPIKDEAGNVVGTFGISKDITEMKKLEIHNQQQKDFMASIIDAIPGKLFIKDHEGKMLLINKAVANAHGTSKEQLIGKSDFDFFDAEKARVLWAEELVVIAGKEMTSIHKDTLVGKNQILQTTKIPFYIPFTGKTGILGIQNDITELKILEEEARQQSEELQAQEEELRQNLEELQAIQEDLMFRNEESKKLQDELAKEKYLLDAMLKNIPDAIYFKDRRSNFIRVSDSMLALFGVNNHEELVGKSDFDFFGEHARVAYQDEQSIMKTGSPLIDVVQREERKDGRVSWMSTTKMPLRDESGEIVGTFGISRDISKLKELEFATQEQNKELQTQEEELRQNLEEMQAIQDDLIRKNEESELLQSELAKEKYLLDAMLKNIPDAIYFKDLHSNFIRVSDSKLKQLGMTAHESLIGKSDFDFLGEHARVAYQDEQNIIKTGSPIIGIVQSVEQKDGSIEWKLTTKMPLRDENGEIVGTFGISRDITQMKELELATLQQNKELQAQEEELRQSLEEMQAIQDDLIHKNQESELLQKSLAHEKYLLETLLANVPDSIYFKDINHNFLLVSNSHAKLFGFSDPKKLIGKSLADFLEKESVLASKNEEMDIMRTGKPIFNVEERAVWKSGTEAAWFLTSRLPMFNQEGQIIGTFGISKDITVNKKMEMELKIQNEELAAQEEELRQHLEEMSLLKEDLQNEKKLLDTLLENIPDAIYFKNLESKYTRVSNSMLFLFNEKDTRRVIGKSDFDYLGDNAQVYLDDELAIIKTGRPIVDKEIKEERLDGTSAWMNVTKLPLKNANGQIIGTFGISKNINKTKELELKTKQQKEFFENILDKLPNKIFVKDDAGKMFFVNNEVVKAHGISREKLIGQSDFDFFDAEKAQELWSEEQFIIQNGSKTIIHKDTVTGKELILHTVKMPFYLPQLGKTGLLGIQHDITEIKKLEQAANQQAEELRAQEEELRQNLEELQVIQEDLMRKNEDNERIKLNLARESSLLDALLTTLPESIYFKDKDSKFMKCSTQMAQNFGLKKATDMVGKSDFDFLAYEVAEESFNTEQKIMRTGQGLINKEEVDSISEGERWLSTTKMPLMLGDKVIGTFGITRDVTQIKRAQIEAKEQAEELKSINEEQEKVQTELRWEKQMFTTLMAALTSRVTFKDLTGKYVRVNKSKAEKLQLAAEEEAIGKGDLDFFDRKLSLKQREIEEQVIKTGEPFLNFINKVEYPSGEVYWGDSAILPIRDTDGEILGILDLTKGITRQKEAEFVAFENDFKINGLAKKMPIMVFKINKLGRFTEFKGKATELLNIPQEKLIGSSVFDVFPSISAIVHEGLGDKEYAFTQKYEKNGNPIEVEFVFRENPEIDKVYFGYAYQKSGELIKEYDEIERVKNAIKNLKKK